jgi:hypothetical protein
VYANAGRDEDLSILVEASQRIFDDVGEMAFGGAGNRSTYMKAAMILTMSEGRQPATAARYICARILDRGQSS